MCGGWLGNQDTHDQSTGMGKYLSLLTKFLSNHWCIQSHPFSKCRFFDILRQAIYWNKQNNDILFLTFLINLLCEICGSLWFHIYIVRQKRREKFSIKITHICLRNTVKMTTLISGLVLLSLALVFDCVWVHSFLRYLVSKKVEDIHLRSLYYVKRFFSFVSSSWQMGLDGIIHWA